MKHIRFYLEYESKQAKRRGEHQGNVVAIIDVMGDGFTQQRLGGVYGEDGVFRNQYGYECISALFFSKNSPVCGSSVAREYLEDNCKRISEAKARQIHPNLFAYLDTMED